MVNSIAELCISPARAVLKYAEKIQDGIPEEIFSKKPVVNGKLIDSNHPAFIYGHLSLYPARIMGLLKEDAPQVSLPPRYAELFTAGAACQDDPERKIYPSKSELVDFYFSGMEFIMTKLPSITDAQMLTKSTDERSRERFPILGSFIMYLLTAHPNVHLGQLSTWRRCMGLGAA